MTLIDKQHLFVRLVWRLLQKVTDDGYALTFGETYRSPEEAERLAGIGAGIKNSLHTDRLAIDLNFFRHRKYLTDGKDFKEIGEWWERQHALCRWGGRFADGNHFSLEHEGRQ